MKLFSLEGNGYAQVQRKPEWQLEPFHPQHRELAGQASKKIQRLLNFKGSKDIFQIWRYHTQEEQILTLSSLGFSFRAFEILGDYLTYPGNTLQTITMGGWPMCYYITPVAAPVSDSPTYAEIAAKRPENLHYFRKFEDTGFQIVTEEFLACCKQHKITGLKAFLRWDGKKSYPPVEHLSRAWLEEQMRKNGDL
jgi:hypothetical protein